MSRLDFVEFLLSQVKSFPISESRKNELTKKVLSLKTQELNILITGATGCGKSSTINALFDIDVAKVGVGVDPETKGITKYKLDNLILWDTPGLGDGTSEDKQHAERIAKKLKELDRSGKPLIDLVLVILEANKKDLGTGFNLITGTIIPAVGKNNINRIVIALNQADVAMGGRHWDRIKIQPDQKLEKFLEEKVASVKERINKSTGVDCDPIYYCAGFKEEGMPQEKPYNLSKLLYYIIKNIPSTKRLSAAEHLNQDEEKWQSNDEHCNYNESIFEKIMEGVRDVVDRFVDGVKGFFGWLFG